MFCSPRVCPLYRTILIRASQEANHCSTVLLTFEDLTSLYLSSLSIPSFFCRDTSTF